MRNSLIGKLVLSIMIIWIPISAIVIIGLAMLSSQIAEDTVENQTDKVRYYSAIINADIDKVIRSTDQLCSNKAVVDFIDRWNGKVNFETYGFYAEAYKTLKEYRNISMYINDIFIYIPRTEEILSANHSIISQDGEYAAMRESYLTEGETFFHSEDALYYLYESSNGLMTGIKVSLQDIRYTLRGYDTEGSYGYFFVNSDTKELLDDKARITQTGRMIYEAMDWDSGKEQEIKTEGSRYLVYQIGRASNGFLILMYMNRLDAYASIYALYWAWLLITLLLVVVPVVFAMVIRGVIKRPVDKLQKAMEMVEKENYDYLLPLDESREFNYVFAQYNQMTERVKTLIQEVLEKQVQVEQARYKQLQMQINPHFLFNSLYMGYRMAQSEDCEAVGDLCMYLGDYFGVLTFVSNESISIENELKFVNTYLRLNQMRFGEKLHYFVDVQEGLEDYRIPPLLLQPLIENSISHGMEKCTHPCLITVRIWRQEDILHFSVTDDSGVMTQEKITALYQVIHQEKIPEQNFGLWNIQSRLRQLKENTEGICMRIREDGSFEVAFSIHAYK